MRLTIHTDYALRTLIYLAAHRDQGLVTTAEIAEAYNISMNHLIKIVNQLGHLGYIRVVRGKGGGIELAQDPADLRIGQIVLDLESDLDLVECFNSDRNECCITSACALKQQLKDALDAFIAVLDQQTLQDVIASKPRALRKLLALNGN